MIGETFFVPTSIGSGVEGVVIDYEEDTGRVSIETDEKEILHGFEYQLESLPD